MTDAQVLVLGGGVSGVVAACLLADAGIETSIIDRASGVMRGASRWNEGKIHLGYTYVGTDAVATAHLMQEGAAVFEGVLERVTGRSIPADRFTRPIIYLVDQHSIFDAQLLWARTQAVHRRLLRNAVSLSGLRRFHDQCSEPLSRISGEEAGSRTGLRNIADAWTTPERAVAPGHIADELAAAVQARSIPVVEGQVVGLVREVNGWSVSLGDGRRLRAPVLINALWEGRPKLDRLLSPSDTPVSIRWKAGLFGSRQTKLLQLHPSTRILGRFGDVTPYANGDVYLSWYPANMIASSEAGEAPRVPDFDPSKMIDATLEGLGLDPAWLEQRDLNWEVQGGFVVAQGSGDIDQRDSGLHDRSQPGVTEEAEGYVSVDTGKFSLGPLMGWRAAAIARRRLRQ